MIKSIDERIYDRCKPTQLATVKQIHSLKKEIRCLEESFMYKPTISKDIMLNLARAYLVSYSNHDFKVKEDLMNHYLTLARVLDLEERRIGFTSFEDFCWAVEDGRLLPESVDALVDAVFLVNQHLFYAVDHITEGFYLDVMQARLQLYEKFYSAYF